MEGLPNKAERYDERVAEASGLLKGLYGTPLNNAVVCEMSVMLAANLLPEEQEESTSYALRRAAAKHLAGIAMNDESPLTLLYLALECLTALSDYWDLQTIREEIKSHPAGCECEYCIESAERCNCKDCKKKREAFERRARAAESLIG